MQHSEMVESLINRLKKAEYPMRLSSSTSNTTVLSNYNSAEVTAAKQAITEWLQDNINDSYVETDLLKQRVKFLEEMVSKSNFKPFVED